MILPKLLICGCYRSGTTILSKMMNDHPQLLVTNELMVYRGYGPSLQAFRGRLKTIIPKFPHVGIQRKTLKDPKAFFRELRRMIPRATYKEVINLLCAQSDKQLSYFGDKYPPYAFDLKQFSREFKDMKVIFCIRDPRDVIESQLRMLSVKQQQANLTVEEAIKIHPWLRKTLAECFKPSNGYYTWLDVMREWDQVKKTDLDYYELYYSNLVEDTAGEAAKIANYLGIDDVPMVEIFERDFIPPRHEIWKTALPNINEKLSKDWKKMMRKYGFE